MKKMGAEFAQERGQKYFIPSDSFDVLLEKLLFQDNGIQKVYRKLLQTLFPTSRRSFQKNVGSRAALIYDQFSQTIPHLQSAKKRADSSSDTGYLSSYYAQFAFRFALNNILGDASVENPSLNDRNSNRKETKLHVTSDIPEDIILLIEDYKWSETDEYAATIFTTYHTNPANGIPLSPILQPNGSLARSIINSHTLFYRKSSTEAFPPIHDSARKLEFNRTRDIFFSPDLESIMVDS